MMMLQGISLKFVCKLIFNYPVTVISTPVSAQSLKLYRLSKIHHAQNTKHKTHYMYAFALATSNMPHRIILSRYGTQYMNSLPGLNSFILTRLTQDRV